MTMRNRIARLFTIKTRTEVWLVIYALALGAVERGRHYLEVYPGNMGMLLALLCTGVVFLAGAKLLDSVKPPPQLATADHRAAAPKPRHAQLGRARHKIRQTGFGSRPPLSPRSHGQSSDSQIERRC